MKEDKMRAGITPSTTVHCCTWVPLDNTYQNTLYFDNKQSQYGYFSRKVKYSFDAMTYQRVNTNAIRVEMNAERLMDCNYLFFQNSAYGSKWFYAFITEVNYINDVTTELVYELDVMQTWFFDFALEQSFVEREHTATDEYFQYIKDEGLETGPYCYGDVVFSKNFSSFSCAVMTTTNSKGETYMDEGSDLRPGGKYSGVWSAANIFVFDNVKGFFDYNAKLNEKGNVDEVVAAYMVPTPFVRFESPSVSAEYNLEGNFTIDTQLETHVPVYLGDFNGYKPKNKKLYCYPYNFLVADGVEDQRIYRYEMFNINGDQTNQLTFNEFCTITPNPTATTVPYRYEGVRDNSTGYHDFSNALNMSNFPLCGILTETYKAWVAQNANSAAVGVIGSFAAGAASGAISATMFGGPVGAGLGALLGGTVSAMSNVFNVTKQVAEARELPNKSAVISGDAASMAKARTFKYINRHITYEYAKQIDDFFTMFGYKIGTVKIPNINVRPYYTYTKTIGCNIRGNIPAQYAKKICDIFDAGVTHWKNGDLVGDYSVDNRAATKTQAKQLNLDPTYTYQNDDYESKIQTAWAKTRELYDTPLESEE